MRSIFWLLRAFLRLERERLRAAGVRLQAIGRRHRLPSLLLDEIERTESVTVSGLRLRLRVALDYSSRESIARAALCVLSNFVDARPRSAELLGRMLHES